MPPPRTEQKYSPNLETNIPKKLKVDDGSKKSLLSDGKAIPHIEGTPSHKTLRKVNVTRKRLKLQIPNRVSSQL
jgi:hypothetical protein